MKKIIKGKQYNTQTATEVGYYSNEYGAGDFRNMSETLYLKKTGEYFLYGTGGAMTGYAEACEGGGCSGGSVIKPLSVITAKEWAEKHLDADDYMKHFGEVEE